jgi:hypothetical protein
MSFMNCAQAESGRFNAYDRQALRMARKGGELTLNSLAEIALFLEERRVEWLRRVFTLNLFIGSIETKLPRETVGAVDVAETSCSMRLPLGFQRRVLAEAGL